MGVTSTTYQLLDVMCNGCDINTQLAGCDQQPSTLIGPVSQNVQQMDSLLRTSLRRRGLCYPRTSHVLLCNLTLTNVSKCKLGSQQHY